MMMLVVLSAFMFAEKTPLKVKPISKSKKTASYCIPNVSDPEALTLVSFGAINNRTASSTNVGYEDFTNLSTNVGQYRTYQIKLQANTEGDYYASFTVYIDFNQDGILGPVDYKDEEGKKERFELGYIRNSNGNDGKELVANITIPGNAIPGSTRMRVMKRQTTLVPIVYATDGCNLGNTYGQVEDYSVNIFTPQGCDTAVNGANLTAMFVPKNNGQSELITNTAKTGAYTDIFVIAGASYDFKLGKETVFSTLKRPDATTARTSDASQFSWTSDFTGVLRWYTHADESNCSADNSIFSEEITSSLITNSIRDACNVGVPNMSGFFTMENGGAKAQELAIDIPMFVGKFSTIKGITVNMADATFINFEELNTNSNGLPGTVLSNIQGTIESKTLAFTQDGKNIYTYKIKFDKPILTDGALGAKKWLKLLSDAAYVEVNPSLKIGENITVKNNVTGSWQIADRNELVYQLEADCRQDMCTQVVVSTDDPTDNMMTSEMGPFIPDMMTAAIDVEVNPNENLGVNGIVLDLWEASTVAEVNNPRMLEFNLRKHNAETQEPGDIISEKIAMTSTREKLEEFLPDPTVDLVYTRWKVNVKFNQSLLLDGAQSPKYWLEVASDYTGFTTTNDVYAFVGSPTYIGYLGLMWVKLDNEMVYKLLTDCSVLGTQNTTKQEKTKLYPVPFVNTLTISSPIAIRSIEIYNVAGAKVVQKEASQSKVELNLSNLPTGMYIVKTIDVNGNVDSQKVIKK